jgi:hypothetical protein
MSGIDNYVNVYLNFFLSSGIFLCGASFLGSTFFGDYILGYCFDD